MSGGAALDLRGERDGAGTTRLVRAHRRYPWSMTRAFWHGGGPPGLATVIPQSVSGLRIGGDRVAQQVEAGPGAALQLAFAGAELIQPARSGAPAELIWGASAEPDALLEIVQPPTVLRPGAELSATARLAVGPGALLLWSEVLTWTDPEAFRLSSDLRVATDDHATAALARLVLDPDALRAAARPDGAVPRALGQVLCLGETAARRATGLAPDLLAAVGPETYAGAAALPNAAGLAVTLLGWGRDALSTDREAVRTRLWRALVGCPAPDPRTGPRLALERLRTSGAAR
ncbi:MAG: urease accessory protein UreD [Paracoccaceae bacterium]